MPPWLEPLPQQQAAMIWAQTPTALQIPVLAIQAAVGHATLQIVQAVVEYPATFLNPDYALENEKGA